MYNISTSFNYFCKKSQMIKIYFAILFTIFSFYSNAQFTIIIDSNFEQKLIDLGYDDILDSNVFTYNIDSVTILDLSYLNISNLSGIEDFSNLKILNCSNNNLSNLNLSQNLQLKEVYCSSNNLDYLSVVNLNNLDILDCSFNNLINIDVSQNIELDLLQCSKNQLTELEVNTNLGYLYCGDNNLEYLELDSMIFNGLFELRCENNDITTLNLQSNSNLTHLTCHNNLLQNINLIENYNLQWLSLGNNPLFVNNNNLSTLDLSSNCNITNLYCNGNVNLICIEVCEQVQTDQWITDLNTQQFYSLNCNYTDVEEITHSNRKIISISDMNGRISKKRFNQIQFFIYENGTVKKQFIIDD